MSRHTSSSDSALVDQLVDEFITRCNYVRNASFEYQVKRVAIKAAELCKELNVDAATYVQAHTMYAPVGRGYTSLTPAQLYCRYSKQYVEKYLSLKNDDDKQAEFEVQCNLFSRCLDGGWDQNLCLANPSFDFAPWFRVLMTPERNEDIIKKYGASATHILTHDPVLLKYLRTVKSDEGNPFDFSRLPLLKL